MLPEVLFLKYAFPCAFIIRQRGEISFEEFQRLEFAAAHDDPLPRMVLEKIFFRAFQRIDKVATRLHKDRWDAEVIREYFVVEHNKIIDEGMYSYMEAPSSLKELCKVQVGVVVAVDEETLVVEYNGKRRPLLRLLLPQAQIGAKVLFHYGYAVEFA
ncbi:MAG: hypothetical protein Q7R96_00145 [Nanoarchaeota archaeon]|nr:hypothetical protein [Nanoarchaeota archaeon]